VGPQYVTCLVSPIWHLEFWDDFYIFGKFVDPCMWHIIFLVSWFKCLPTFCIWNFDSYTSSTSWVSVGNFLVCINLHVPTLPLLKIILCTAYQREWLGLPILVSLCQKEVISKEDYAVQQVQASTCIRKVMKKWKWSNLFKHMVRQLLVWRQVIKSDSVSSDANMCSWLSWTENCSLSGGDVK
jgi:hypothetical protein